MLTITTADYKKVLKSDIENFRRVLISGSPGIGKSAILKGLQAKAGEKSDLIDTKLSSEWEIIEERIYNRGEFATGIPTIETVEGGGETTVWTIPEWMLKIKNAQAAGKKVCLLLDDFHLLVEELQKPMYEFFESFQLNGFKVEPCSIVILGNYNVEELSMKATVESPIMGRMHAFYQLAPDFQEWMMNVDVHQKILVYISQNKHEFYTENPENTTMYPSPRTWCKASETIEAGHPLGKNIFAAILGQKTGSDLASQWEALGMTIDEMLTPTNNVLDNAIKTMLLSKEVNLDKGKQNFFSVLETLDKLFTKELTMNFFLTTLRKFQKSEDTLDFYQTVVMGTTAALNSKSVCEKPKEVNSKQFEILKKYISKILATHEGIKK